MTGNRIVLDAAAFVDSRQAALVSAADRQGIQEIAQRFLTACYDDAGEAPKLLDGEQLHSILERALPLRFGVGDDLIEAVPEVLTAFFEWLWESEHVVHQFEQAQKLDEAIEGFLVVARSGAAHLGGQSLGGTKTVEHRAEKTGRNDPCPCGSGKKFKKCCMTLG